MTSQPNMAKGTSNLIKRPIGKIMTAITRMVPGGHPAGAGSQKTINAVSAADNATTFDAVMSG